MATAKEKHDAPDNMSTPYEMDLSADEYTFEGWIDDNKDRDWVKIQLTKGKNVHYYTSGKR